MLGEIWGRRNLDSFVQTIPMLPNNNPNSKVNILCSPFYDEVERRYPARLKVDRHVNSIDDSCQVVLRGKIAVAINYTQPSIRRDVPDQAARRS
jgi:hypothetical protein